MIKDGISDPVDEADAKRLLCIDLAASEDQLFRDAEELRKLGVAGVFGPGAPTSEIVDFIRGAVPA